MNRSELIREISHSAGLSVGDVEIVINGFVNEVVKTLAENEKVSIEGFGRFEMRDRAEKRYENPKTKQETILPQRSVPCFKSSVLLKERIKQRR